MLILDAHLDLALNALEWNRDLTLPLEQIRRQEAGLSDKPGRGRGTVSLPEMREAGVGLCVATLLARVELNAWSPLQGWRSQAQAWATIQGQLAWYNAMEEAHHMRRITSPEDLREHVQLWQTALESNNQSHLPIGYLLSLEGADSLLSLDHLHIVYGQGLRALGPAHYGPGIYANGTDASGRLSPKGRALLQEASDLGILLDVTHLCDDAFWDALDLYEGPLWASHHNCRALVPHNRQISDEMICALAQRDAVIGVACDAWMLSKNWVRGKSTPQSAQVFLSTLVEHIDHLCQIAGSSRHVGIGSDLDGCFGTEQTPADLQSIRDLQKLRPLLASRGYSEEDIQGILHGNFLRAIESALEPDSAPQPRHLAR
jgi:membrane dipeptidase